MSKNDQRNQELIKAQSTFMNALLSEQGHRGSGPDEQFLKAVIEKVEETSLQQEVKQAELPRLFFDLIIATALFAIGLMVIISKPGWSEWVGLACILIGLLTWFLSPWLRAQTWEQKNQNPKQLFLLMKWRCRADRVIASLCALFGLVLLWSPYSWFN